MLAAPLILPLLLPLYLSVCLPLCLPLCLPWCLFLFILCFPLSLCIYVSPLLSLYDVFLSLSLSLFFFYISLSISLSLSLSLSLSFSLSFSLFSLSRFPYAMLIFPSVSLVKDTYFHILNYFCWNKAKLSTCWIISAEKCTFRAYVELFLQKEPHFSPKMLLSAEMLNMLNHVGDLVWKMCFFLRKCWICWICWMFLEPIGSFAYRFKKHSTYSAYSTFLQKEAHFSNKISNMIQHIQHFCSFELILYKKCFFLQKCWICWIMLEILFEKCASFCGNVEYVEYVECFWNL